MRKTIFITSLILFAFNTNAQLSVILTSTAASCSTCCDVCITLNVTGGCPPYTASWLPADPIFPPCIACPNTTYMVTVTDCIGDTITGSITPDTIAISTNINNHTNESIFSIYPNPNTGNFTIDIENTDNTAIEIYNISGQLILQRILVENTTKIDLMKHSKGMYFIRVETPYQTITQKIIYQ